MSLLAVAAFAASVLIARQRDVRLVLAGEEGPGEDLLVQHPLDAIRAAGL